MEAVVKQARYNKTSCKTSFVLLQWGGSRSRNQNIYANLMMQIFLILCSLQFAPLNLTHLHISLLHQCLLPWCDFVIRIFLLQVICNLHHLLHFQCPYFPSPLIQTTSPLHLALFHVLSFLFAIPMGIVLFFSLVSTTTSQFQPTSDRAPLFPTNFLGLSFSGLLTMVYWPPTHAEQIPPLRLLVPTSHLGFCHRK